MAATPKWTARKRKAFIRALRRTGIVTAAVDAVKLSRSQAYQLRKTDPDFRLAWDDALQAALDELELELRRRALEGVEQPVYYGGRECGRIRTYNDSLGMFLLRTRRPGTDDTSVPDPDAASPRAVVEQRLKQLAARTRDDTGK